MAHLGEVIGEAARRVSSGFCAAHPQIPCKAIVGMRHKVVHNYLEVDDDVVWDTVTNEQPGLVKALAQIVRGETTL